MPHSDIRGSTIARISPRLFAACHVLHRLLVPRHPPNALRRLLDLTQGQATPRAKPLSQHEHLIAPTPSLAAGWRKADARRHPPRPPTANPLPHQKTFKCRSRPLKKGSRAGNADATVTSFTMSNNPMTGIGCQRTERPNPTQSPPSLNARFSIRSGGQMSEVR